jgi:hypothetical protein
VEIFVGVPEKWNRPNEGMGTDLSQFISAATCVFNKLLARCQQWWPKWHPLSTAGTQTL